MTTDWFLRILKGIFIGSGFILPGVSGGALAAVFGLYERMITFLANITKGFNNDFKENVLYFLPVGIGGISGVFIFSFFLSYFFEVAQVQLTWFFIGCIVGTLPILWVQAGREGRKFCHIVALVVSLVGALVFLQFVEQMADGGVPLNFYTWLMAGALIALGIIVPGLSPSNLLLFLQMYEPMTSGIASLNFSIMIPIGIGGLFTILAFSKLMVVVFERAYGLLSHAIIGFVLASTILIIPIRQTYTQMGGILSVGAALIGILLALWMTTLERRYK